MFKYPNSVVVDIDFSYFEISTTKPLDEDEISAASFKRQGSEKQEAQMPPFPKEFELLKQLHFTKNRKMTNYNKVYPEETHPEECDEENFIVNQVREVIFRHCFQPFLEAAFKSIMPIKQSPKYLNEFWNENSFLEYIEENFEPSNEYYLFALSLC